MAFINPIAFGQLGGVRGQGPRTKNQEPNNINDHHRRRREAKHFANLMSLDGIKKARSDEIKNKTTRDEGHKARGN